MDRLLSRTLRKEWETCTERQPQPRVASARKLECPLGGQPGWLCGMLLISVQMRTSLVILKPKEQRFLQGLCFRVKGILLNLVFSFQSCSFLDGLGSEDRVPACDLGVISNTALTLHTAALALQGSPPPSPAWLLHSCFRHGLRFRRLCQASSPPSVRPAVPISVRIEPQLPRSLSLGSLLGFTSHHSLLFTGVLFPVSACPRPCPALCGVLTYHIFRSLTCSHHAGSSSCGTFWKDFRRPPSPEYPRWQSTQASTSSVSPSPCKFFTAHPVCNHLDCLWT